MAPRGGPGRGAAVAPRRAAQDAAPLVMGGVMPGGLRASATENWGTFDVTVANRGDGDRTARVLVFFESRPEVQYGRDVWLPAHSTVSTWMLAGPAGVKPPANGAAVQWLLYDRTDGADRPILAHGDERVPSKPVLYRVPEPSTSILFDEQTYSKVPFGRLPQPEPTNDEAYRLAQLFRQAAHLADPDRVSRIPSGPMPPTEEAFDGVDHLIVASDRLADDPAGMRAVRRWLEQGGRVWVMLDRVHPNTVAALLGDALDFEVVDHVGLTSFQIETQSLTAAPLAPGERGGNNREWKPAPLSMNEEQPVEFARVLLPRQERPKHTINGWPLWFTRPVGRGKVIFTTLGPRGWYQWKKGRPVPTDPLTDVAEEVQPPRQDAAFQLDDVQPMLAQEVGYSVVGPWTVALIFGGFLLAALLIGFVLRRLRRRELLGWIGPAAAVGTAAVFVGFGEASRRSAPPTVAAVQIVDAVPDTGEAAVHGLMAVYQPDSGLVEGAAEGGGFYVPDARGAEGQTRRFIQTDLDAWHWENLSLPAGLRFASFHAVAATAEPITAVGRFGPDGLEGRLSAGPFRELSDAVLAPPNGRGLAVHLAPDGTFHVGGDDALPKDQYLAGAVLSDRQQRRQEVYRKYLIPPPTGRPEGPDVLLAWAKPIDLHFTPIADARAVGDALLAVPLRLERPDAGRRVVIPGPLVPYRRILGDGLTRPTVEGTGDADMHLRFQLPASVLPFRVERVRVSAKINAPSRRVVIAGWADGSLVELRSVNGPLDPIRIDVADARLLRLDEDGGLHLNVSLTGAPAGRRFGE